MVLVKKFGRWEVTMLEKPTATTGLIFLNNGSVVRASITPANSELSRRLAKMSREKVDGPAKNLSEAIVPVLTQRQVVLGGKALGVPATRPPRIEPGTI